MCPKKGEKKYKRNENLLIAKATYLTQVNCAELNGGNILLYFTEKVFFRCYRTD